METFYYRYAGNLPIKIFDTINNRSNLYPKLGLPTIVRIGLVSPGGEYHSPLA